jgi:integrase
MAACSVLPPQTQEKEKRMRRKRFQRGCLKTRKRNGKNYWYAQWREEGKPKSKEIGLCSKMDRVKAEGILTEILKPINEGAENPEKITWTFAKFCEVVYLPVCHRKWKASTDMVETNRLEVHLVRPLGAKLMQEITRSELQALLDEQARTCGRSMVDHLRFRLRSVFALAMSEGVVDRNPASALFTPRHYQEGRGREVLTPEQAATLIGALELREKVIVRLATWEGMRPGEILALQTGDLDDDSVWVRRRVYKGDIDEPKTKRSTRRVALTVGTLAMLDQWKLRLLGSPAETWIFGSEKGTPMRRDNIWRKSMYPKLKPVGLEWATFQVMRRTFATLSKAAGVDAHTRSAQMGNTVDVNENEYAVASFEQKLAAVRKLESVVIQ